MFLRTCGRKSKPRRKSSNCSSGRSSLQRKLDISETPCARKLVPNKHFKTSVTPRTFQPINSSPSQSGPVILLETASLRYCTSALSHSLYNEPSFRPLQRQSGWNKKPWQVLKGGAVTHPNNANSIDKDQGENIEKIVNSPVRKPKKSPTGSKRRHVVKLFDEESPPKKRKLLNEYKQRTPRKSPHKTPTKRRTPRLRCGDVLCRVGFSTQRAKEQHERFTCPFIESSPLDILSSLSNQSADSKTCRYCNKVFSEAKNRKRHEIDQHRGSASILSGGSGNRLFERDVESEANIHEGPPDTQIPQEPCMDINANWKTPNQH